MELTNARTQLKPARSAFADPEHPSIQVGRARKYNTSSQEVIEAPEKFADRIVKTRAMISDLQQGAHGRTLIEMLEEQGTRLNPRPSRASYGDIRPLVTVLPRRESDGSQFASEPISDLGFRKDGVPGPGSESTVYFDDRPHNIVRPGGLFGMPSEHPNPLPLDLRSLPPQVLLGHELIHSLRDATGIGLVPPADKPGISHQARSAMRLQEELETIGLKKVRKGLPQHPTENDLRSDYLATRATNDRRSDNSRVRPPPVSSSPYVGPNVHASLAARTDYGGKTASDLKAAKKKLPETVRK